MREDEIKRTERGEKLMKERGKGHVKSDAQRERKMTVE